MSILSEALITAYEKGYRATKNGNVISPFSNKKLKLFKSNGYCCVSVRLFNNKSKYFPVHRLVAFQKFGDKVFKNGICVRHLDSNKLNNSYDNIGIGTHSQNMMDIDKDIRLNKSIKASNRIRKFTDSQMIKIKRYHKEEKSYKKTMLKFNISSKGSLYYILNTEYQTSI